MKQQTTNCVNQQQQQQRAKPRHRRRTTRLIMMDRDDLISLLLVVVTSSLLLIMVTSTVDGKISRTQYHEQGVHGPHSYKFGFTSGDHKNPQERHEVSDKKGHVKGWYSYKDPHGKMMVFHYEAHPKKGFKVHKYKKHHHHHKHHGHHAAAASSQEAIAATLDGRTSHALTEKKSELPPLLPAHVILQQAELTQLQRQQQPPKSHLQLADSNNQPQRQQQRYQQQQQVATAAATNNLIKMTMMAAAPPPAPRLRAPAPTSGHFAPMSASQPTPTISSTGAAIAAKA